MHLRVIAIDWSGAAHGGENKIWLAEVDPRALHVVRLEPGRTRTLLAEHLMQQAAQTPELVVGLDFAFSLPDWFLEQRGLPNAPALWDLVAQNGEQWLADCAVPFWGRSGTRRPQLPELFRRTEREVPAVGGIRPKSVFQIGGAGAVGTASIRGMPILKLLREGGFSIWPFDEPRLPMLVEIYPRVLTGAVDKANAEARRLYLDEKYPALDETARERAISSDDAFDALVSALVMAEHASGFSSLPRASDTIRRREGQIWFPDHSRAAVTKKRRLHDSSNTRVAPVFNALASRASHDPQWLTRVLDLAVEGVPNGRLWRNQDMRVTEHFWAPNERGLQPPVALLSWLIRNFEVSPDQLHGDSDVVQNRRKLAHGDPATIQRALQLLRRNGAGKAWYVLEGPTYPDALLVTSDALVVVEGKRTEAGPTTSTTWMPRRHQMIRHLDAAWEIRGRRSVYGLFIVEGEDGTTAAPALWRQAARDTMAPDILQASLPHRSSQEQQGIAAAFLGMTTWQAIRDAFSLDPDLLLD